MTELPLWVLLAVTVITSASSLVFSAVKADAVKEAWEWQARATKNPAVAYGCAALLGTGLSTAAWIAQAVVTGDWRYAVLGIAPIVCAAITVPIRTVIIRRARRNGPPLVTMHVQSKPGETPEQTSARVQATLIVVEQNRMRRDAEKRRESEA